MLLRCGVKSLVKDTKQCFVFEEQQMAKQCSEKGCVAEMEGKRPLNRDVIKYIAIGTMFLNHVALVFLEQGTLLYEILVDIGYFTAVTMIYFMVEGYDYTRSRKAYAKRLLLFAILSQIPYCLAFTEDGVIEFVAFNMLFTLLICFGIIHIMKTRGQDRYARFWNILLTFATFCCDWGLIAPIITILFVNAGKDRKKLKKAWFLAALLFGGLNFASVMESLGVIQAILYGSGCMIPMLLSGVCILYLYNGERMKSGWNFSKWFFYLFYPTHLLILGVLRLTL